MAIINVINHLLFKIDARLLKELRNLKKLKFANMQFVSDPMCRKLCDTDFPSGLALLIIIG